MPRTWCVDDLVAGGQLDRGRLRADHLEREHRHDLGDRVGFGPRCGDLGLGLHDGKQLLFPVHPRQIGARALELEPAPAYAVGNPGVARCGRMAR